MNFIIECDDEQQQIQVLQKLENKATIGAIVARQPTLCPLLKTPVEKR